MHKDPHATIRECSAKLELLATGLINPDQGSSLTLNAQALHGLFVTIREIRQELHDALQDLDKQSN